MALYITLRIPGPSGYTTREFVWYIGMAQPRPSAGFVLEELPVSDMVKTRMEVQADGDEMRWVLSRVKGIREVVCTSVMHWVGDDAHFIIRNLFWDGD